MISDMGQNNSNKLQQVMQRMVREFMRMFATLGNNKYTCVYVRYIDRNILIGIDMNASNTKEIISVHVFMCEILSLSKMGNSSQGLEQNKNTRNQDNSGFVFSPMRFS